MILLLLGLGCSKKEQKAPPSEPSRTDARTQAPRAAEPASDPSPNPEPGASPWVELRSPGEEPRRPLRWKFTEGFEYSLQMRAYETMELEMDLGEEEPPSMANPPVVYELSLQIRELTDEGTARVAFVVTHARTEKSHAASAEEQQAMKEELRALRGLAGSYSVDARGLLRDLEYARDSATAKQATVDRLSQLLRWTTVPLPQEDVGKGAEWTVKELVLQDGMKIRQQASVKVLDIRGSAIDVSTKIERTADQQKLSSLETAEAYELLELESLESIETEADLEHLVPRSAKAKVRLKMATRADSPDGTTQDVQMSTTLKGTLRGSLLAD